MICVALPREEVRRWPFLSRFRGRKCGDGHGPSNSKRADKNMDTPEKAARRRARQAAARAQEAAKTARRRARQAAIAAANSQVPIASPASTQTDLTPTAVSSPAPAPAAPSFFASMFAAPAPAPAPTPAPAHNYGDAGLDWRGKRPDEPDDPPEDQSVEVSDMRKIPMLELEHDGRVRDAAFVPLAEIDSVVAELDGLYDFGLGEMHLEACDLGRSNPKKKSKPAPKRAAKPVKVTASVSHGTYRKLEPARKPTTKAPVRAAIKSTKKPVVFARKKTTANSQATKTLSSVLAQLQAQGKILNLLAKKREIKAESDRLLQDDEFKNKVADTLRKIDKQVAGDAKGNYFARWNKLKAVTGVSVHER